MDKVSKLRFPYARTDPDLEEANDMSVVELEQHFSLGGEQAVDVLPLERLDGDMFYRC